ncbi:MAG: hypothetical protein OQK82_02015 [Candidatus Pacearchaeota archaeon]|nr:hypothetical protein [Candidatus Pacearchaeota archaeon]
MNLCAELGKVVAVNDERKHFKFLLSVWQERTCHITCVIFNPSPEDKEYVRSLHTSALIVWVQGWLVNHKVRIHDKTILTMTELATTRFNIKEV